MEEAETSEACNGGIVVVGNGNYNGRSGRDGRAFLLGGVYKERGFDFCVSVINVTPSYNVWAYYHELISWALYHVMVDWAHFHA